MRYFRAARVGAALFAALASAVPAHAAPNVGDMQLPRIRQCYVFTTAAHQFATDEEARLLRPYTDAFTAHIAGIGETEALAPQIDDFLTAGAVEVTLQFEFLDQAKTCAAQSEDRVLKLLAIPQVGQMLECYGVAAAMDKHDEGDTPWVTYMLAQIMKEHQIPSELWYMLPATMQRVGERAGATLPDEQLHACLTAGVEAMQPELAADLSTTFAAQPASPERDAALTMLEIPAGVRYLLCLSRTHLEDRDQQDDDMAVGSMETMMQHADLVFAARAHLWPGQEATPEQDAEADQLVDRAVDYVADHMETQPSLDYGLGRACVAYFS